MGQKEAICAFPSIAAVSTVITMARATNLGLPRIGPGREMKRAIEGYWAGSLGRDELAAAAAARRETGWHQQVEAGIDLIPSNDFSLYDQVLDTCCLVGAVPPRFGWDQERVDLDTYFAMARGAEGLNGALAPLEMTKWWDTNYHYLVPELGPETTFRLGSTKPLDEFAEARALGITTRPVLIGPVTFLLLARPTREGFSPLDLLGRLLPVYKRVLAELASSGCEWVQLDEPSLVTDLPPAATEAFREAYATLAAGPHPRALLATYFGALGDNLELATSLPIDGLHLDLARGPEQLDPVIDRLPTDAVLSAGVVDGRNVWRHDLRDSLARLGGPETRLGPRLWVSPSCSLQHVPHDLELEDRLDPQLSSWLAFAHEKLGEVAAIRRGLTLGVDALAAELEASDAALADRRQTDRTHSDTVRRRVDELPQDGSRRSSPPGTRRAAQQSTLVLPLLPTTTIGSFPQTPEIRRARRELSGDDYTKFCEGEIERVIRLQESIGLDVLVHGEPERNDMVQYFAERLEGFATTSHGWVQSYGTRYVRPPILYGDASRSAPITLRWTRFAQSLTPRPVKGMLTGPITILQWSFVRDDLPRSEVCRQIALAIRDEVADLEAAGTRIIQVDEPALREGLPLRRDRREEYLAWATECFRLATTGVADGTQIHTHMCYAAFGDIVDAIRALDVDVVSLEAARSNMEVLDHLSPVAAAVGPGVYDIHSPLVPTRAAMAELIERALRAVPASRLWVNPDCGLKTRHWDEVIPALGNLVGAACDLRRRAP
jgi:5-methyltetrahydropteroyltriglutamate--homocysteine methyltransferase